MSGNSDEESLIDDDSEGCVVSDITDSDGYSGSEYYSESSDDSDDNDSDDDVTIPGISRVFDNILTGKHPDEWDQEEKDLVTGIPFNQRARLFTRKFHKYINDKHIRYFWDYRKTDELWNYLNIRKKEVEDDSYEKELAQYKAAKLKHVKGIANMFDDKSIMIPYIIHYYAEVEASASDLDSDSKFSKEEKTAQSVCVRMPELKNPNGMTKQWLDMFRETLASKFALSLPIDDDDDFASEIKIEIVGIIKAEYAGDNPIDFDFKTIYKKIYAAKFNGIKPKKIKKEVSDVEFSYAGISRDPRLSKNPAHREHRGYQNYQGQRGHQRYQGYQGYQRQPQRGRAQSYVQNDRRGYQTRTYDPRTDSRTDSRTDNGFNVKVVRK